MAIGSLTWATHLSHYTGEGRCPWPKWVPAFAGKAKKDYLNHLHASEE